MRTGYALAPWLFTHITYPVTLTLVDDSGLRVYGPRTFTYTGHFAEFVTQRFPEVAAPFYGHMKVEVGPSAPSLTGVAVEVLRMEVSGSKVMYKSTPANWYSLVGNDGAYFRAHEEAARRSSRNDLCKAVTSGSEM